MILKDLSSMPAIGRVLPRVGVSLALAASLFGIAAGQLVHADGLASDEVTIAADGAHLPFIVCGLDTRLKSGGNQSILLTSGGVAVTPAQIDPAAIGQTFNIHGWTVANCGAGESFMGVADRTANAGSVSLPANLAWLSGNRAGPTSNEMAALSCAFTAAQGCNMLVPIATGTDGEQLQSVIYALMEVRPTGANGHSGTLLGDASALNLQNP
jgi:hypothetical protein